MTIFYTNMSAYEMHIQILYIFASRRGVQLKFIIISEAVGREDRYEKLQVDEYNNVNWTFKVKFVKCSLIFIIEIRENLEIIIWISFSIDHLIIEIARNCESGKCSILIDIRNWLKFI